MNEQTVGHLYNGLWLTKNKEPTTDTHNIYNKDASPAESAKWKEADSEDYLLCDSIYMTFWKRQDYKDRDHVSGC